MFSLAILTLFSWQTFFAAFIYTQIALSDVKQLKPACCVWNCLAICILFVFLHSYIAHTQSNKEHKLHLCFAFDHLLRSKIFSIFQVVFEGMEEVGSEGLDDLIAKLKKEGWLEVSVAREKVQWSQTNLELKRWGKELMVWT